MIRTTNNRVNLRNASSIGFFAVALTMQALPAYADLLSNASFETTTGHLSSFQLGVGSAPDNWTFVGGIGCVVFPGTSTTNACGGAVSNLWDGATSPDGGNFIVIDGDPSFAGTLSQSINVVAGQSYSVSFYQAAGQFHAFNGATTEKWRVTLGTSASQDSTLMNNVAHGFTGWNLETLTFTANTTGAEVLKFFAVGTPSGAPPAVFLDGVTVAASTPEPATFGLIGLGLLGVFAIR